MSVKVQVFNAHNRYRLEKKRIGNYVRRVLIKEGRKAADISVILIDAVRCRSINRRFLHHDYSTDVLSFPLESKPNLEGEIYVNLDKAKQQARTYRTSFAEELARLVIHGTLHLVGFNDGTSVEKRKMRTAEEHYLMNWFGR